MWPDRVSNPGPLTHESGALPTALRGPVGRKAFCLLYSFAFNIERTKVKVIFNSSSTEGVVLELELIFMAAYQF